MFDENGADPFRQGSPESGFNQGNIESGFNQGNPESGDVPAWDGDPSLSPQGYDGGTSMVTSGQQEKIEMENVGPLRAWWENQTPAAKLMYKALGIGALIFAGKFAVTKAIDSIKKKGQEELIEEEEIIDDEEDEEQ